MRSNENFETVKPEKKAHEWDTKKCCPVKGLFKVKFLPSFWKITSLKTLNKKIDECIILRPESGSTKNKMFPHEKRELSMFTR